MSLSALLQQSRTILLLHPLDLGAVPVAELIGVEFQNPLVIGETNSSDVTTYGEFLVSEIITGVTDSGDNVILTSIHPISETISNRVIIFTSLTDALGFLSSSLMISLIDRGNHLIYLCTLGITDTEYNRLAEIFPATIPLHVGFCNPLRDSSGIRMRRVSAETVESDGEVCSSLIPLVGYPRLRALVKDIVSHGKGKHLVLTGSHHLEVKAALKYFDLQVFIDSVDDFNNADHGVYLSRSVPDGLGTISHLHFYDPDPDALFIAGRVYQHQTCRIDGSFDPLDIVLHIPNDDPVALRNSLRIIMALERSVEMWEILLRETPRIIFNDVDE